MPKKSINGAFSPAWNIFKDKMMIKIKPLVWETETRTEYQKRKPYDYRVDIAKFPFGGCFICPPSYPDKPELKWYIILDDSQENSFFMSGDCESYEDGRMKSEQAYRETVLSCLE